MFQVDQAQQKCSVVQTGIILLLSSGTTQTRNNVAPMDQSLGTVICAKKLTIGEISIKMYYMMKVKFSGLVQ